MCPPAVLGVLGSALAMGATVLAARNAANQPAQPLNIQQYTPKESPLIPAGQPEAPAAAPIMSVQGQEGADDQQRSAEDARVRRNKQGRNALRIDKTDPMGGAPGGSGLNIPGS